MEAEAFIRDLESYRDDKLHTVTADGWLSLANDGTGPAVDADKLLRVALANEINVSELAAVWMPTTPEVDVKLAFARQAGDEAGHFELVRERLMALGVNLDDYTPPAPSPLMEYLRSLATTVERIAGGLFTLEAIAQGVNENFMGLCARRGDSETVRIYREFIQPDEREHQAMGRKLLAKYATTPDLQRMARDVVARTLEIAAKTRAKAAERLGTSAFPGC